MTQVRRGIVFSFYFVRHGETNANKDQRIQGHRDIPLNATGENQASLAGMRLKDVQFTRAYASDLGRAHSTCQIILKHNIDPPSIVVDTKLRERNFGSVEGVHIDEAKMQAAAEGKMWAEYNPPGAEKLGELQARMVKFFKELCQSVYDKNKDTLSDCSKENAHANGKSEEEPVESNEFENLEDETDTVENILVVGHGAALKQLFMHLHSTLGCPIPSSHQNLNPLTVISPNTGISHYLVRYSPKKYELLCVRLHDGSHLQEL